MEVETATPRQNKMRWPALRFEGSIVPALLTLTGMLLVVALLMLAYRYGFTPPAKSARAAMSAGQYKVANNYYKMEADKGNPAAQNSLGNLYYLGLGVPRDIEKATDFYFQSASQGFASAQINLGNMFSQGLGVPADAMRAFAWYRMSNISGSPTAELYMTQIATEYTLSPLQISTVSKNWPTLKLLVEEGLD